MNSITDDSYAQAAAAIAELKAAGGYDLTGYEHLWAAVEPGLAVEAMLPGEIWAAVGGNWVSLGVAASMTIDEQVDTIDFTHLSGDRHFKGGLKQTTLHAEFPLTKEAWTWLQQHGHANIGIRVGTAAGVIETEAALDSASAEFDGGISQIRVSARLLGAQTIHPALK